MRVSESVIYYDGLCLACSTEINHYRKQQGSQNFIFLDITDSNFHPEAHGIDPSQAHKVMHVRDSSGKMHQGVDAFRAIWRELPRYHFLYRLSKHPIVRSFLELGYKAFVKVRPFLPRKKQDCSASPYCEISHD